MINQMRTVAMMATMMPQLAVLQSPHSFIRSSLRRVLALSAMFLVASAEPSEWMAGIPAMKFER